MILTAAASLRSDPCLPGVHSLSCGRAYCSSFHVSPYMPRSSGEPKLLAARKTNYPLRWWQPTTPNPPQECTRTCLGSAPPAPAASKPREKPATVPKLAGGFLNFKLKKLPRS